MVDQYDAWRGEADDEWLATHRGSLFASIRRLFRPYLGTADAASRSDVAVMLGGAPRNPPLKVRGTQAEVVRYAEHQYAYTRIRIDLGICQACGGQLEERHRVTFVTADNARTSVGTVRGCRRCDKDSWLFHSGMPATCVARERDRRVVL